MVAISPSNPAGITVVKARNSPLKLSIAKSSLLFTEVSASPLPVSDMKGLGSLEAGLQAAGLQEVGLQELHSIEQWQDQHAMVATSFTELQELLAPILKYMFSNMIMKESSRGI